MWFQWFRNHHPFEESDQPVKRLPDNPDARMNVANALERLIDQPGRSRQLQVTKTDLVHAIDALETHGEQAACLALYVAEYPAFRSRPVGGPNSEVREQHDRRILIEDRAKAALALVQS